MSGNSSKGMNKLDITEKLLKFLYLIRRFSLLSTLILIAQTLQFDEILLLKFKSSITTIKSKVIRVSKQVSCLTIEKCTSRRGAMIIFPSL